MDHTIPQKTETTFNITSLNSITDPAFTVDKGFNITSFNRAAESITGYKRWDVVGKKCYDIFQTNICQSSCALKQAMRLGEKIVSHNIALKNGLGLELPVIAYSTALFNSEGDFVGGVETFHETAEISAQQCHNNLSASILESIADGAFSVDHDWLITSFNKAAEEITGIHRSDAVGKKCYEVFKADICTSACALKQSIETGRDVTNLKVTIHDAEGDPIPIMVTTSVLRNEKFEVIGGVETFRDISTLEKLRRDISLSDSILDSIADGAFSVDKDWNITSFNKSAEDITGVHRSKAIGKKCYEVFKADICKSSCALKKSMDTSLDGHDIKVTIEDVEGDKVPIRVNTCVLRNDQGEIIGGVETFRDTSTIDSLRKELSLSDCILNSIGDGAFTVDKDWYITSFNLAAEHITGFKRKEAIGKKCYDIFKANICKESCALKQSMDSGDETSNLKVTIINKNGRQIPINVTTSALRDEDGIALGGVETFRDCSALESLRKEITDKYSFQDIISKNHRIKNIFAILPNIAKSDSTVLIEGPSGSGKELFAKAIHTLSERAGKYVALNCAALPDTLLESELFGYKKGAFTGAKTDKIGRFALAEKGTIFLDEIGDISPALQLKLLRVLQEKEYEPLGSNTTVKADVRVLAATNKNLHQLANEGIFREDLFFRLNVVKINLPPLAERREDIPLLVDHFIQKFNNLKQKNVQSASPEVVSILMRHDFPGNIRELENIIEYCFVLCHGGIIDVDCLPDGLTAALQEEPLKIMAGETATPLSNAEAGIILATLQKFDGNRGKTASHLGIEKTTLWRKMKKYQIDFPVGKKG
ncbi:MAG: sigma 54-interacting transcriptional regulator [Proteobacteria bacterium]|nr:sigma 54-interacting transcriptional regulator [Pseudomonadota bacterium]MBU1641162.1 sigma 54-interacting transcriptional regulator [Pseudomonadota bacterium]